MPEPPADPPSPAAPSGDLVVVARVRTAKAPIVAGALEAEGIAAVLDRPGFGALYGLHSGAFATAILVPASQAEPAQDLIESVERDLG